MSMFAKDKKTGEIAVKKAYAFLKKAGFNPLLPHEIKKDHDIILEDGRKIEIKFDVVMDSTSNLGVEWWSDKGAKVEGWGQYCEAEILIQFYNMDNAVVVDWHKFKEWLLGNFDKFERKDSKYSNADVILVPMETIPHQVKIHDIGVLFSMDYELENWELDAIRGKKYKIEPAKSSQAICTSCGEPINKNDLRISDGSRWLHLDCAASEFFFSEHSIDRLFGIDDLNDWQVEHVRKVVRDTDNSCR